jgi:predicted ATP-grasp superfamily ATP-dependent carboligase/CheY-like chemotaxis protein
MTLTRPRVLVVGDRPEVAIVACRSLGKAGYQVGVTGDGRADRVRRSRYVASYHALPSLYTALSQWQAGLQQTIRHHGYDVAIASSDSVLAGWRGLHLGIPVCPNLEDRHLSLTDKSRLAELAVQADVPYPDTRAPGSPSEDEAYAREVRGPRVVKAAQPAYIEGSGVTRSPRPRLVDDPPSARRAMAVIRAGGGRPIIQDQLVGSKLQAVIIRRGLQTSCRLSFRVLREYPAGGAESMLAAVDSSTGVGARMVTMLERLADAARYQGILSAEFIEQPGTGMVHLMDPNPRLWGSVAFAELLGMRMCERVVLDALGHPPPPPPRRDPSGRRYHDLVREIQWLAAQPRIPSGYIKTFGIRDLWNAPSPTDPLPDVHHIMSAVGRRLRAGHGP